MKKLGHRKCSRWRPLIAALVEEIGTERVGPLVDLVWMLDEAGPVAQPLTFGSQSQVHTTCVIRSFLVYNSDTDQGIPDTDQGIPDTDKYIPDTDQYNPDTDQ
jgi:hypothetical protein